MQNRRDHVQAYQFAVERLVRAAVAGRAGTAAADAPFRRSGLGASIGIVLSVLICAGALVYGLISPAPSTAWRNPGAIIVQKETGTRYLMLGGQLHPTANYASALLAAGTGSTVQFVPRAQLAGIPVGATIGIVGAPDDVPPATSLLPAAWALCARQNGGVVLDLAPAGHTGAGPAGERILVASTDRTNPTEYVVWDSVKYPLPSPTALPALGLGDQQPLAVPPTWLAALPPGAPVVPATISGLGAPGPAVGGRVAPVGTLYSTVSGGAEEDYVLLSDGLAPISHTEAALFTATGRGPAVQISTAAVATAQVSADRSMLTRLPDFLSGPLFAPASAALCVQQSSPGTASASTLVTESVTAIAADPPVVLPADTGMLVEPPGQSQAAQPIVFLVADTGKRYLLGDENALSTLGYSAAGHVVMPLVVLGLIPAGPILDSTAAAQAVPWQAG